jgi:hypothetical protein
MEHALTFLLIRARVSDPESQPFPEMLYVLFSNAIRTLKIPSKQSQYSASAQTIGPYFLEASA